MRVILAMPTTYIILALGVFSPFTLKRPHPQPLSQKERGDKNDSPSQARRRDKNDSLLPLGEGLGVRVFLLILLLLSTLALPDTFQPSRWIGQPPLPTPLDEVFTIAANRIRELVLVEKRSVLLPQAVYGVPTVRFLLQENFSPTPPANPAPTDSIALFWPTDWQRWFGATVPSFILLSPSATNGQGYIETIGQWSPDRMAELEQFIQAQANAPDTETIHNRDGQPLANILTLPRPQLALHAAPTQPLKLQFGESLQLQGYEVNLTKPDTVDVALFLHLDRHVWADYTIWLQWVDSQNRVVAEKREDTTDNPAFWSPHQLTIDHHALTAPEPLAEGIYVLKLGWQAIDFRDSLWLPVYDEAGRLWPATPTPLGLIQIGAPLEFAPMSSPLSFGKQLNLTGYKLTPGQTAHHFNLALQWQNDQPLNQDYTITIQWLDQNHRLIAQIDNPPLGGAYPTSTWQPRRPITDSYELELPPTITPGDYLLVVGVYDWQTLQRLSITSDHEQLPELNLAILQHLTLK